MARPAVGDRLAVPLDRILEPEAGATEAGAPRVHDEVVVELRRLPVPDVDLGRRRLDALLAKAGVPAVEPAQILDARGLEPDEVRGVVRDSLRVRLCEPDPNVDLEAETVDEETLRRCRQTIGRARRSKGAPARRSWRSFELMPLRGGARAPRSPFGNRDRHAARPRTARPPAAGSRVS